MSVNNHLKQHKARMVSVCLRIHQFQFHLSMQCNFQYATLITIFSTLFNIQFGSDIIALDTLFRVSEMLQHSTHFIAVSVLFGASRNTLFQVCLISQIITLRVTFTPCILVQGSAYFLIFRTLPI